MPSTSGISIQKNAVDVILSDTDDESQYEESEFHQIRESDHFKIVIFNGVTEMMVGYCFPVKHTKIHFNTKPDR